MIIISTHTPHRLLRSLGGARHINSWIFLGTDELRRDEYANLLGEKALEVDFSKMLYQVCLEKRSLFVKWIDSISENCQYKKEWMFSSAAIKNTASSNLFLYFCYFYVLQKMLDDGTVPDVAFVESFALIQILRKSYPDKIKIAGYLPMVAVNCRIKFLFNDLKSYVSYIRKMIKRYLVTRRFSGHRAIHRLRREKRIILIRNYVTDEYEDRNDDRIEKHYFPGLYQFLQDRRYSPVFFPIPVNVKNFKILFQKIQRSKRWIVFAEEILKIEDYMYAFLSPLKMLFLSVHTDCPPGKQFLKLIYEEKSRVMADTGYMDAHLMYCLGPRMKSYKIILEGVVNWAENQAFEKGLIYGLRAAFPDLKVFQSQPFFSPPNHLSMVPSEQDNASVIKADKYLVLGSIGRAYVTEFSKNLQVDYTPAFRYEYLFHDFKKKDADNILILLGYNFQDARCALNMIARVPGLDRFDNVFVKTHPVTHYGENQLRQEIKVPIPGNFVFVYESIEKYFDKVSVGICSGTGASVELVVRSIPVIMIARKYGLTFNHLQWKCDKELWTVCFTAQEIEEAVIKYCRIIKKEPEVIAEKAKAFHKCFFVDRKKVSWDGYLF